MKTAVEWLEERYYQMDCELSYEDFEKAKEMEKDCIMTAYYDGYAKDIPTPSGGYHRINPEKYYNETYKNKEQ